MDHPQASDGAVMDLLRVHAGEDGAEQGAVEPTGAIWTRHAPILCREGSALRIP